MEIVRHFEFPAKTKNVTNFEIYIFLNGNIIFLNDICGWNQLKNTSVKLLRVFSNEESCMHCLKILVKVVESA